MTFALAVCYYIISIPDGILEIVSKLQLVLDYLDYITHSEI